MKKALPDNYIQTIKEIAQKLEGVDVHWAIIGSTNMALHGIDIIPNDIDITTNHEGLEIICDLFSDYKVGKAEVKTPLVDGYKDYTEQELEINGVKVTICGEYEDDVYFQTFTNGGIEYLDVEGIKVTVFSLESEKQAYHIFGKEDKVKLIESHQKEVAEN